MKTVLSIILIMLLSSVLNSNLKKDKSRKSNWVSSYGYGYESPKIIEKPHYFPKKKMISPPSYGYGGYGGYSSLVEENSVHADKNDHQPHISKKKVDKTNINKPKVDDINKVPEKNSISHSSSSNENGNQQDTDSSDSSDSENSDSSSQDENEFSSLLEEKSITYDGNKGNRNSVDYGGYRYSSLVEKKCSPNKGNDSYGGYVGSDSNCDSSLIKEEKVPLTSYGSYSGYGGYLQ